MSYTASKYHPAILERLVVLYAQFSPVSEIHSKLEKEFGVKIPFGYIKSYVLRPGTAVHTKMISLREKYCKSVMEVSVAQKVVRLREIEKIIAANSGKTDRDSVNAVLRALAEARAEVEGSKVIQFFQFNKYEGITDADLRARKLRIIGDLAKAEGLELPVGALAGSRADRRGVGAAASEVQAEILHSEPDSILLPPEQESD